MQGFDDIWTGGAPVADWNAAYDNSGSVRGAEAFVPRWQGEAAAFRERLAPEGRAKLRTPYGAAPRRHYDLFLPEDAPRGLFVFVHGGYWKSQEINTWSHFAGGMLARGFAAALPEYTLCPDIGIAGIVAEIGACLDALALAVPEGDIVLAGHSAGGHLVSRMLCRNAPILPGTAARIARVLSISGVHDLRPLLATAMNDTLGLDAISAAAESPALLLPRPGVSITCLVGGAELPEFRRQNALLANAWAGLGARTVALEAPGRHHFDVVDELLDPASPLVSHLADGSSQEGMS